MKQKVAIMSWVAAMVFAIWGFLAPPKGSIDSSVLILIAQLLVLCATFLGVESYVNLIDRKFFQHKEGGGK